MHQGIDAATTPLTLTQTRTTASNLEVNIADKTDVALTLTLNPPYVGGVYAMQYVGGVYAMQ